MDEVALEKKFKFGSLRLLSRDLSWYRIIAPALSNLGPLPGWSVAARIGRLWASRYLPKDTIASNLSGRPFPIDQVLEKIYAQWAVSSVVNYSFLKWDRHFLNKHIQVNGQEQCLAPRNNSAAFYFSAHNFLMFAIISMLGIYGHSEYPFALNPNATVPPHLVFMFNRVFNESAALMNGGRYIFTDLDSRFNRDILDAMRGNSTFFAAVDFPKGNFAGEWQRVSFLDSNIEIPSRLFKFAFKNKIPSFFVHMRWDNTKNKLILDIEKLPLGTAGSVAGACALFAAALEKRVAAYPESWEGWKWPGVFK